MNLPDYIQEDWERMVQESQEQLQGTCPLLDDETIVFVDNYIKSLENEIAKAQN